MRQKIYQVDAFTDRIFQGNPAAVCPLEEWLSDDTMQKIAMENNLSETAFYVKEGENYRIRWFTPTVEVDLCGHATLATGFVLFNHESHSGNSISFITERSGMLKVTREDDLLTLDFPADRIEKVEMGTEISDGFNLPPRAVFKGKSDYLLIYSSEDEIVNIIPEFDKIAIMDCRGVIVTAPGKDVDFVSRFFGPQSGVNEDPVTGSAHTTLATYWSGVLGKQEMTAIQLSSRRGYLRCRLMGDRVAISGTCRLYMTGYLENIS
jgi:PhzF family phenazine biosynthesis protein